MNLEKIRDHKTWQDVASELVGVLRDQGLRFASLLAVVVVIAAAPELFHGDPVEHVAEHAADTGIIGGALGGGALLWRVLPIILGGKGGGEGGEDA